MALDPQTKTLLDAMNAMAGPKLYEMAVEDARIALQTLSIENGGKQQELKKVENRMIDGPRGPRLPSQDRGGRPAPGREA